MSTGFRVASLVVLVMFLYAGAAVDEVDEQ